MLTRTRRFLVLCPMEPYDDCSGRCEYLSITDDGIAQCHEMVLGKLKPPEPKVKEPKPSKSLLENYAF